MILVALCFVAVLGIALASYIAVCLRAMTLSNRTHQQGVSEQLAEMGLEEALRAFNTNNWSGWTAGASPNQTTVAWSTSGNTATGTITLPPGKYGKIGVTGAVNLRVDNYNAFSLSSVWSSSKAYNINDLVGYDGIWYRCVKSHPSTPSLTPPNNLAYWAGTPISWAWNSGASYKNLDVVNHLGTWYRATGNTTATPGGTNWVSMPTPSFTWDAGTTYPINTIVYYYNPLTNSGTWYRKNTALPIIGQLPPLIPLLWVDAEISWRWKSPGQTYNFNDVVYYSGTWYRCVVPYTTTLVSQPPSSAGNPNWVNALNMWAWSSAANYSRNDVVCSGGLWYRCLTAHINQAPPNATYWATAPLLSNAWSSGKACVVNDVVSYNGVWYHCTNGHTSGAAFDATKWASAATTNWSAVTPYAVGNHASYGGVWYRCLSAHTNKTPNNSTYWTAVNAPVIYAQGVATLPGGNTIKTQLRATVDTAPLFPNAAAAATTLSMSCTGTVDSYNSNAGAYGGSNIGYSAVLAGGSTTGAAVTISSGLTVSGYVAAPPAATSPHAALFSYGTSTVVKGTSATPSPKVDPARVSRNPFIPQFDCLPASGLTAAFASPPVSFPAGTALTLASTLNLGTPGAAVPSRYYHNGDLNLGATSALTTLNINGPVILYIKGDLHLTGSPNGAINVNSTGSAEIHVGDSLLIDLESDGIKNNTLDPKKLILICDTTAASIQKYSDTTTPFHGLIYMPNTTNGNGLLFDNSTAATTIYGAISARKISYTSTAALNLHYDTSLRSATISGVDTPYVITDWRELTDPAEKAVLP